MVVSPQAEPSGPGMLSLLSAKAIRRGECPLTNVSKNAPHNIGCLRHNATATAYRLAGAVGLLHDLVPVAETAARLAGLDPAAQSTPRLVGEVFQEQRIHCAFEPDVQVRDLPFGQGDDLHRRKRHALEDSSHILLIPADAIERFGQHDIKPAIEGVDKQPLDTGTNERSPGHGLI